MFLVDTSVWVEVFRKPSRIRLEGEIPLDQIAACRSSRKFCKASGRSPPSVSPARILLALPMVESPLTWDVFEMGAQLYRHGADPGTDVKRRGLLEAVQDPSEIAAIQAQETLADRKPAILRPGRSPHRGPGPGAEPEASPRELDAQCRRSDSLALRVPLFALEGPTLNGKVSHSQPLRVRPSAAESGILSRRDSYPLPLRLPLSATETPTLSR